MKRIILTALFTFSLTPLFATAQEQCRKISCDCDSLLSESWKNTCINQESRLVANCFRAPQKDLGYCSLHGPAANRLPLALEVENSTASLAVEDALRLNNKVAVLYWSMYKGFDAISEAIEDNNAKLASTLLKTFEYNLDDLFGTQQLVTTSFLASNSSAQAQAAWRDYSSDTLTAATDIFMKAESVLNNYDALENTQQRNDMRLFGLAMMDVAGKMYEQVGFAYGQGQRHKHAAQAWKNASKASALAMSHTFSDDSAQKSADYLRLQSAARLHRASYHWTIGLGHGSAEKSLAESQKFMDNNSELSGVVNEERRLKEAQPFWQN